MRESERRVAQVGVRDQEIWCIGKRKKGTRGNERACERAIVNLNKTGYHQIDGLCPLYYVYAGYKFYNMSRHSYARPAVSWRRPSINRSYSELRSSPPTLHPTPADEGRARHEAAGEAWGAVLLTEPHASARGRGRRWPP